MTYKFIVTLEQLQVAIGALEKLQEDYPVNMTLEDDPDVLRNIKVLWELKELESI